MNEEEVEQIMENIFRDESLGIIRDALEHYELDREDAFQVVVSLKDGRNVLVDEGFATKDEAVTYTGLLGIDDFDQEIEKTIVCEVIHQ